MNKDGKSRDNCYLILELPYDAPGLSEAEIAKAINNKKKFWSRPSHIKNGAIYEDYLKNIKNIQEIMMNPDLRNKEAALAKQYIEEVLPQRMLRYSGLPRISPAEVNSIEDDTGIPRSYLEAMIPQRFGIQIAEKAAHQEEILDPNPKPEKADTFKRSVQQLTELNFKDLYAFLQLPEETIDARRLGNDELKKRVRDIEESLKKASRNAVLTYKQNLCKLALKAFENDESRKEYDDFLIWLDTDQIIRSIKSIASVNDNRLIGPAADNYLKQLIRIHGGNAEKARKILEAIGKQNQVLIAPALETSKVRICPNCARVLEGEKKIRICPHCGASLYIICPHCKTENDASARFCVSCRSSFADLEKVLLRCQYARDCIRRGDLDQARLALSEVEASWPDLQDLRSAKEELQKKENILRKPIEEIDRLISDREFFKAKKKLDDFRKMYPEYRLLQENTIKAALEEAEKLFARIEMAEKSGDTLSVIRFCEEIIALCADYPGVREKLIRNPPKAVTRVTVRTDPANRYNVVSWDPSSAGDSVTYLIRRKISSASQSLSDGEDMGEYSSTTFTDRKIKGGLEYYYTVFVRRAGIDSKGVSNREPAVNYMELNHVQTECGDGFANISWEALPSGIQVRAFRKEGTPPGTPGEGKEVRCTSSRLMDEGLKNNITYGYLLCCVYSVGGKQTLTKGVQVTATPFSLPEPADELEIHRVQGEIFEARWKTEARERVELYFSENEIPYDYGDSIPVSDLGKKLQKINPASRTLDSCRFQLPGEGFFHIITVICKYETAIFGDKAIASNMKAIEVRETTIVGKDIYILAEWPRNARAVVALYRFDSFPVNVDDREAYRAYITQNAYRRNNALVIKDAKEENYHISLFAEVNLQGQIGYTQVAAVQFNNAAKIHVKYSITVGGVFGKQATIMFKGERPRFILPAVDIYQAAGIAPIYKSKGSILEHIDEQEVEGSLSIKIPLKGMKKGIGIRPFFTDDALYQSCSLKPEPGTDHMIT